MKGFGKKSLDSTLSFTEMMVLYGFTHACTFNHYKMLAVDFFGREYLHHYNGVCFFLLCLQETQELQKKQSWYQQNQVSMSKDDEEEYLNYCSEAMFRIHILELRLNRYLTYTLHVSVSKNWARHHRNVRGWSIWRPNGHLSICFVNMHYSFYSQVGSLDYPACTTYTCMLFQ